MVVDGIYYALGSVVGGLLTAWLTGVPLTATPFFVFAVFALWFFRDPECTSPNGPFVLSPADGKVMAVKPDTPAETRISIFLNIFDVHVNRSPVAGVVDDVQYRTGAFLVASKETASAANEQNVVTMRTPEGSKVVYKQIAGLLARRIVFNKRPGDTVRAGERIGLMKFGSRMDVLLGPEWRIRVQPGARVVAGVTVLADRETSV